MILDWGPEGLARVRAQGDRPQMRSLDGETA